MQLEFLKFFCDAVRYHSFSRAAEANGVTQSAVSQAVHQLEARLGVQLVDRSRRPWVLTPEGRLYYEKCQELLDGLAEVEALLKRRATGPYPVRVAAIYSVGLHDMSRYVERLRTEWPGAEVTIKYVHPRQVYEAVLQDTADLGLVSFPTQSRELAIVPWRDEPMVLVCPPQHRFAHRSSIRPDELTGERLVAFEEGLAIRRAIDRYLRQAGAVVEPVGGFDNIEMIKRGVEEGLGVAILPRPTLDRELQRGSLVAVPLEGCPFYRPLCVIYRRRRFLNPAVKRFVELLTGRPWSQTEPPPGKRRRPREPLPT
jgi:DNA-binding transcriptional LysR family regulator